MASDMATRRLRKELMAIKRNPIDNIVAMPMDSNILEWHYVITGTKGSPYEGGHYHGKLKFPPEYPMKPPSVMMMTPNGRFACSRRLCLSMSDFHPESWNPMWSVSTILMGLYSFMLDNAATLGSVTSSTAQKKRFATESLEVNCKNPAFRKLFPDLVELHERRKSAAIAHRREVDASASAGSATSGAGLTTAAAAAAAAAAGGGPPSGGKAGSGALQPAVCPGFAFSWLELVSHRSFMPKLLLVKQNKGWSYMHRLLIDLLIFMEPHLRRPTLLESVRLLYQGMLRTLLVLLHDFPEFLSDYHLSFCDVIPAACIQLRNLILAAFPRSMRLPDPFTPNLKVDLLPEIALPPRILSNYVAALSHNNIKQDLDKFLQTRHQPANFLTELPAKLRLSAQEAAHTGMTYNVPCMNSLVVYVGSQAIQQLNNKTPIITHSAPMDVFHQLANKLDPEGRYFFLNAIANQLRYPNQHTHYYSCVLLYLFAEAQSEMVQEQITRILLERLIVHRPHPWGLLITFIELIKNPRYSFWSHSFTHCAPELERVFESVARSCMTPGGAAAGTGADETVASGQAQ